MNIKIQIRDPKHVDDDDDDGYGHYNDDYDKQCGIFKSCSL